MVARQAPNGIKLTDGYRTLFAFRSDPDVALWEKIVKPPGLDGGEAIDTTTMHNDVMRTFALRALKTLTESTFQAGFDPKCYDQLIALINVNDIITLHFPDESELDFWGGLRTFDVSDMEEGTFPMATCAITPTNQDADGNEVLPNYKPAASGSPEL